MTQPEPSGPAERRWGELQQPDRLMAVDFYDAELRAHNDRLRTATHVRPGDRVLDIGVTFESRAWLITAHRTVTIRPATTERNTS